MIGLFKDLIGNGDHKDLVWRVLLFILRNGRILMELLYSYVLSILYRFVYSGMMVATMFIDMERKMHLMSLSMVSLFSLR